MTDITDLIRAEQARARRLHPDDHAGHPEATGWANMAILADEVREARDELFVDGTDTALAWELIQVAGVASAWAQQLIDDGDVTTEALMHIIEEGETE